MSVQDPFVCPRCGDRAEYHGRVSAPPHMIYKCVRCGHESWVSNRAGAGQQQQQQQQVEPRPDSGDDTTKPDDTR